MQLKCTQTVQTSEVSELSCRIQELVLLEQATTNHDEQQPQDSACVLDDFYENYIGFNGIVCFCIIVFMYICIYLSSTLCQYSFCYFWICLWETISAATDPLQGFSLAVPQATHDNLFPQEEHGSTLSKIFTWIDPLYSTVKLSH